MKQTTLSINELSTTIANTMNQVNRNCFTATEIQETILEYNAMLSINDTESIIEMLSDELTNSYGSDIQHTFLINDLLNQVLSI